MSSNLLFKTLKGLVRYERVASRLSLDHQTSRPVVKIPQSIRPDVSI
jgi:hypothetical protein